MMKKEKIIAISFVLMLAAGSLAHLVLPDREISWSERRNLHQLPELELASVMSGKYFTQAEEYLLDQFPARDFFRSVTSVAKRDVLGQKDVDGIYLVGDGVYKLEYTLSESSVKRAAEGFTGICKTYFPDCRYYFSVIPDKNYFVAEKNGYPALDYARLEELMREGMTGATFLPIFGLLEISDYYRLDLHWKQECILDVAQALLTGMDSGYQPQRSYETEITFDRFYGTYYFQAAAPYLEPDRINCLGYGQMQDVEVFDYEKNQTLPVYNEESLKGVDAYDVYLSGAKALLELKNPHSGREKTLYLFRDSFGSSMAPLLLENYSRIVMIDLRYVTPAMFAQLLGDRIESDSDVLFLYNTMILNQSMMLKF